MSFLRTLHARLQKIPFLRRPLSILFSFMGMPEVRAEHAFMFQRVQDLEYHLLPKILSHLSDLEGKIKQLENRQEHQEGLLPEYLRTIRRELEPHLSREVPSPLPTSKRQEALEEDLDALVAEAVQGGPAEPEHIQQLVQRVKEMRDRLEFIRKEEFFELRYSADQEKGGRVHIPVKILNTEKFDEHARSGPRLNLGAGHVPLEDYLNIDSRDLPGIDVVASVQELPFPESSVQEIFSSHLLEHFPVEELRRVLLPNFYRMLRPGGILKAIVPDAEAMIRHAADGDYPFKAMREVLYGSQEYDGDFHFNIFTPDSLTELLQEAGFHDVQCLAQGRKNGLCYECELQAVR